MPYQGGRREQLTLRYDPDAYLPYIGENTDFWGDTKGGTVIPAEARKEYNRLRSALHKRIKRMEEAGDYIDTETYRKMKRADIPIGKIPNTSNFWYRFNDLARISANKMASQKGMKDFIKKSLATLHGDPKNPRLPWVTEANFQQFGEFMEYARAQYGSKLYDSGQTASFYQSATAANLNEDQIYNAFMDFMEANLRPGEKTNATIEGLKEWKETGKVPKKKLTRKAKKKARRKAGKKK